MQPAESIAMDEALFLRAWPDVADRLGERRHAFFDTAVRQLGKRGLGRHAVAAARYLNLCFAFGPAFEERPEHEWALAILSDGRLGTHVKLHQLLQRAAKEWPKRGGNAEVLKRNDHVLLDALEVQQRGANADAEPIGRTACDVEAAELRWMTGGEAGAYRRLDGSWQRAAPSPLPSPLRLDLQHPWPQKVCVLSTALGDAGTAATVQLRQIQHGQCSTGRHPAVRWLSGQGVSQWQGSEAARSVTWSVHAERPLPPATGLGFALAEETSPAIGILEVPSCGLRDEGVPLGAQRLQLWAYPASQWMFALQREPALEQPWPPGAGQQAPAATQCRVEWDGEAQDVAPWLHGFDHALPQALAVGCDRLLRAWSASAQDGSLRVRPSLLTGRQVLAWGWRLGDGLADDAVLRLEAQLDLQCALDLTLEGTVQVGGAKAVVSLKAEGGGQLRQDVLRDQALQPLAELSAGMVIRWRAPFEVEFDPLASAEGVVFSEVIGCTGALVGEAGLRPRLSGGSGLEWFARVTLEPVSAVVRIHDPVLGQTERTVSLLPALGLLDWSLG